MSLSEREIIMCLTHKLIKCKDCGTPIYQVDWLPPKCFDCREKGNFGYLVENTTPWYRRQLEKYFFLEFSESNCRTFETFLKRTLRDRNQREDKDDDEIFRWIKELKKAGRL